MSSVKPQNIFFCSAASRYFKEDIHGTAANFSGFILLEHSDPFPEKIKQAHFDSEWLSGLEELAKKRKAKLLLVRNKRTSFRTSRLIYVDCIKKRYTTLLCTPGVLMAVEFEKYIEDAVTHWETEPFFVVCTNGKKDKCCAKFGFPVFKFLENHDKKLTVYESSHVGGDRFAANAVYMPFGIYYGRLTVEDVDPILEAAENKKIFFPNYRGISTRSFLNQTIECYLRKHLDNYYFDFSIKINKQEEAAGIISSEVLVKGGNLFKVVVEKKTEPYPYYLTCKSNKPGNITRYYLRELVIIENTH